MRLLRCFLTNHEKESQSVEETKNSKFPECENHIPGSIKTKVIEAKVDSFISGSVSPAWKDESEEVHPDPPIYANSRSWTTQTSLQTSLHGVGRPMTDLEIRMKAIRK